ncbi:hypothetical protein D3C73_789250 [compost metagenome]
MAIFQRFICEMPAVNDLRLQVMRTHHTSRQLACSYAAIRQQLGTVDLLRQMCKLDDTGAEMTLLKRSIRKMAATDTSRLQML